MSASQPHSPQHGYRLGCPVWACHEWIGRLTSSSAKKADILCWYSRAFNTVEGNSTFYALPKIDMFRRWAEQAADGFTFSFKFPQQITHERELVGAQPETDAFLALLEVLHSAQRLGHSILQLGPKFGPRQLGNLRTYLQSLPRHIPVAVEVRHKGLFDEGSAEGELNDLLREAGANRILFDSRPLYSKPPSDAYEEESQRRKPRSPFRTTVTGSSPMVRLVGRNNIAEAEMWFRDWAKQTADWITAGLSPIIFTHAPADVLAPDLARMFHAYVREHLPDLPDLPAWPVDPPVKRQLELF